MKKKLSEWIRDSFAETNRMIAVVFAAVILLGTLLLLLPVSSRDGRCCGWMTALFTSTSATCVTGLVVRDTWSQWSGFGQGVILALIEIGGLGFMSAASFLVFLFRGRMGMRQQMVMAQSLGSDSMGDILHLQKWMLRASLSIEGIGALILTLRFLPQFGLARALKLGVFHSVSAFCNAGFDIWGFIEPGASASIFGTDPAVLLTLSALVIVGGLGFVVWEEMARVRSFKKLSVYSRLVLIATGVLLVGGCALILLAEHDNPATFGEMTWPQKVLASFFQSVTLRTAGFAGVDQGALTDGGKAISMFLMLIGGSSGSTAGGLKTVTLLVILLFLWSRMRGKQTVVVFHRTIPTVQTLNALSIFGIMVGLAFFGTAFLCLTSNVAFADALYEALSALATVGLSCGVTPKLSAASKLLIILYMYFGRVGVLTISLGFLRGRVSEPRYRYADTTLLIG